MPTPFDRAWLGAQEQRVWRLLLLISQQLPGEVNRQLQADSPLGFQDFDVLVHLQESPGRRMRLGDLAEALGWERSRASHHVTRMARRALVTRERVSDDGRGAWVVATPAGLAELAGAAPGHMALVRELVFDVLDERDLADLERVFTRLARQLGHEPRTLWHLEPDDDEPGSVPDGGGAGDE